VASERTIFNPFNEAFNTSLQFARFGNQKHDNSSMQTTLSVCEVNPPIRRYSDASLSTGSVISHSNLCQNFAFPPPPPGDRRRPGPRRFFTSNREVASERTIFNPFNEAFNTSLQFARFGSVISHSNLCQNFAFPPPPPGDRRRPGPRPCPVCYLPVEEAMASMPNSPSPSPVLQDLSYFHEGTSTKTEPHEGSDFGGYPSLKQRNESFDIKESMTVHCGFVKGCRPGYQTGFDIDVSDLVELEQIIVVHNIPYTDSRRNGKVPKLLLHRLFPNVRYSIWIDGKLQLVVDPYQLLERFLWRDNATFAISKHYRRFDVFEEAEANKAAGKYDNASIDYQIDFYRNEGLTPYSEAKLPIISDVPEGCVIIREHIPITNLFTCLWFNEVDRFTSRDQLSFATVRDKIMAQVDWSINMFMDCERRNFVIQAYHRDLLEHMPPPAPKVSNLRRTRAPIPVPISVRVNSPVRYSAKKNPVRRKGERRPRSRRHQKNPSNRDNTVF
nr:inner membrane protein OxaA [Tanacetum cinerariifolium]